ncbi:MAG: FprA family A-type flavoprotein [Clostridia bacterium]|nr:FprA family A-type flavoprotein [Clostridia bacterium]
MIEIKDDIYYIGVLNPFLRKFDVIMDTEYGTSYNAYLVKSKHNVLIDTVHEEYFDEYIDNLSKLIKIEDISYLVLNHTEPDHSGSVKKLLELNKNIKIFCTLAASKNVQNICNENLDIEVIKDNDTLNIGDKTLKFLVSPFLHWPDTMFTYIEESGIVFTCDFLGTHFSEPRIFDKYIKYYDEYENSFKNYYDAIFSPFKKYVLNGIEKLKNIKYEIIAPSHGPILTKNIDNLIEKYSKWSSVDIENQITIVYASAYGYTRKIAETIKEYISNNSNYLVKVIDVGDSVVNINDLQIEIEKSKAIFIGSPTINKDAVEPLWKVLHSISAIKNRGKIVGVFGSYGWSGEAVAMIKQRLESIGMSVVNDGIKICFNPSQEDNNLIHDYTQKLLSKI